ncbi:hypothetical protein CR513_34699, partial [Mucuna pruriens]
MVQVLSNDPTLYEEVVKHEKWRKAILMDLPIGEKIILSEVDTHISVRYQICISSWEIERGHVCYLSDFSLKPIDDNFSPIIEANDVGLFNITSSIRPCTA